MEASPCSHSGPWKPGWQEQVWLPMVSMHSPCSLQDVLWQEAAWTQKGQDHRHSQEVGRNNDSCSEPQAQRLWGKTEPDQDIVCRAACFLQRAR